MERDDPVGSELLSLTTVTVLVGLLLGLLQGLRHAFEPDHVVAVSTMIADKGSLRARIAYAAMWGLGHAATLLAVGAVLMLARSQLPPRMDAAFGVAVAVMLLALGTRALVHAAWRARADSHAHGVARTWRAVGPLAMGLVHGLAGSGALTALVVARLPSAGLGVAFMVLFGAGATMGMSLLACFAGLPLSQLSRKPWGLQALLGATGMLSVSLGLLWLGPAVRVLLMPR